VGEALSSAGVRGEIGFAILCSQGSINFLVYTSPEALRAAMAEFRGFYNCRRDHEGIGDVTPADSYFGQRSKKTRPRTTGLGKL